MNILLTTDKNYLQYAYVTFVSLLENNRDSHVDLYYVHYDIDDASISRFKRFFSTYDTTVTFLEYDFSAIREFKISRGLTQAVYLRIICGDILPQRVDRVLYLDPDIVVTQSLADLYDTDLGGYFFGAVEDFYGGRERHSTLDIPVTYGYFNSGVMLIDLEKFRLNNVSQRVMDYIRENNDRLACHDQDAFNAVLYDKRLTLHPRWNMHLLALWRYRDHEAYPLFEELREAVQRPAVIHYSGVVKPWHFYCDHPFREEYWRYVKKTPYKYSQPFIRWYDRITFKPKVSTALLIRKTISRLPSPVRRLVPRVLEDKIKRVIPSGK
jgi:UDP-glucose/galactose:(glucosyl)LPS alpha-1,2-glucosyl/galactosyltransferase